MRHPFERLGRETLAMGTVVGFVALALLSVILAYAVPAGDRSQIRDLLQAGSPDQAKAVLAAWPPHVLQAFSFLLGFDFLYDIVHNNAVAFLVISGAKRLATGWARRLGRVTAWVMWLDTALNFAENLAFLYIIRAIEPWPLLPVASAVFGFRTLTLTLGFVAGVLLHGLAFWRVRASAA